MPEYTRKVISKQRHKPLLREMAAFSSLDDDTLAQLDAAGHYRRCRPRQAFQLAQPLPHSAFAVLSGRARLYHLSSDGRDVTLSTAYAQDMFLGGGETADAADYVEATAEGTLLYHIPCEQLWRLLAPHPTIMAQIQARLQQRLTDAYVQIKELALHDVRTRLAHALARLALAHRGGMILETHEELACLIGASRHKVTQELCNLRRQGLIAYGAHQHGIEVLDVDRLLRL